MSKFFYLRFIINKSNMIKIVSGKERDNSIDAVAGIMILYTILMHLGATNEFGEFVDSLHYVFFCFMAWFFFKAGLFCKVETDFRQEYEKCRKRLIIPWITFTLFGLFFYYIRLYVIGDRNWIHYCLSPIKDLFLSGFTTAVPALWFIPVLLSVRLLYGYIAGKPYMRSHRILTFLVLLIIFLILYLTLNYLRYNSILTLPVYCYSIPIAMVFFITGGAMKEIHDSKIASFVCLIGVFLIVRFCFSNVQLMSGKVIEGSSEVVFIIASIMAIIAFDGLFELFSKVYDFPLLRHFGRNSLAYYGFHVPILDSLIFFGFPHNSICDYILYYITILVLVYGVIVVIRLCNWQRIIGE